MNDDKGNDFRVAVIGMAARFPGANNVDEYWSNLCHGVESISQLDPKTAPKGASRSYVHAAPVLGDADKFDAEFFRVTPREAQLMDPQHRVFLECAWSAFEEAGYNPLTVPGRAGVYGGSGYGTYFYRNLANRPELYRTQGLQASLLQGMAVDYLCTRVSYKLGLTGPSVSVQTACSSSLVAIHYAAEALLGFHCDVAVAGGVSVRVPQEEGYEYEEGGIMSPDGHCRPFSADSAGTVFGSGAGTVVLKRLTDAIRDRDHIHAVLLGSMVNNDGNARVGFTAPSSMGQASVIRECLDIAGVDARTIGYVEAHGTGTYLGDPIEIKGLTSAFREYTAGDGFCALGSAKGNIGHLNGAAGVAGFIKAVLAVREGYIPPTINVSRPNPRIDFSSTPFRLATEGMPWPDHDGLPRRAGVSSFGIGGTNAHAILEQPPAHESRATDCPQIFILSAGTEEGADRLVASTRTHLHSSRDQDLRNIAFTLQSGRGRYPWRRAAVAKSAALAAEALETPLIGKCESLAPKVIWIFPGQSSARLQMTSCFAASEPAVASALNQCADALRCSLDFDLWELLKTGSAQWSEIEAACILFSTEYALAALWRSWGITPEAVIGHDTGEIAAACVAEILSLDDAFLLLEERSRLCARQEALTLIEVHCSADQIGAYLNEQTEFVSEQGRERLLMAVPDAAAKNLVQMLDEAHIGWKLLDSGVTHSRRPAELTADSIERLCRFTLHAPRVPLISSASSKWLSVGQDVDSMHWAKQIVSPVKFYSSINAALCFGPAIFVEIGPGSVLTSLIRALGWDGVPSLPVSGSDDQCVQIRLAVAQLWLAGIEPDWKSVRRGEPGRRCSVPTYPFVRARHWVDPRPIEPGPITQHSDSSSGVTATGDSSNRVAETVISLFVELLGVPDIGMDSDFFSMGGNSLVATQLLSRLRDEFSVELPLAKVFENSVVRGLVEQIESELYAKVEEMSDEEMTNVLGIR